MPRNTSMHMDLPRASQYPAAKGRPTPRGAPSLAARIPFSALSLCYGIVGILFVAYIGLIAVVMGYATLTVEFSQSVKNDEAAVALLEAQYLSDVARITGADYAAEGYAKPAAKAFVKAESMTALR